MTNGKKTNRRSRVYRDMATFKERVISATKLDQMAKDFKAWADKDDSFRINDFYNSHGIPTQSFYDFVASHDNLAAALVYAKERIGSRREKGAMGLFEKKLDSGMVSKTMRHYCSVTRQCEDEQAAMRVSADNSDRSVEVIITPAKNTDEVKEKKK